MITQEFNQAYEAIFTTKARYILLWGGRGRGGSHTATDYMVNRLTRKGYFRGYLMREVFSDIRESLWRDFKDRLENNESINQRAIQINETAMSAHCLTTGNWLMSKGFKKSTGKRTAKLKSLAGATHVVIEEAEEIDEEDFMQLDDTLRTTKASIQIILIFNPPPKRHWIWRRWFRLVASKVKEQEGYFHAIPRANKNLLSIFGDYTTNEENLNPSTIANWEGYKDSRPDHYWTVIRGLISEGARGRIYRNWTPIEAMPDTYAKFYGLDWGFSTDPLCLLECEHHGKSLWVDQKIYRTGMTNDDLERELIKLGISKSAPIVADSAQPKDIADMRKRGWNFIPAEKGPGSVKSGINYLKQFDIFVTERSEQLWEEYQNYAWALDQHKEPTDEPIDAHNHGMDALNYAADRIRKPGGIRIVTQGSLASTTTNGRTNDNL